jgi:hypothetical protein
LGRLARPRFLTLGIALAAVPLAFAAGGAVAAGALAAAPPAFAEDLRQPLLVVDGWRGFGTTLFLVLAASILAAAVACAVAVRELARLTTFRRTAVLGGVLGAAALATGAALVWPVIFSSDVYAYAAYGDQLASGADPYVRAVPPGDALERATLWQWEGPPPRCVYGPLYLGLARVVVGLSASRGPAATLLALRASSALAFLACIPLFFALLPSLGGEGRRLAATACFALNPVAIWSVAEGHNDALMLLFALGGAALVRFGRPLGGGLVVGLAALVKLSGLAIGLAAVFLVALQGPARARGRAGLGVLLALAVAAAGSLPLALGLFHGIAASGHYLPQFSLQALSVGLFALAGLGPVPAARLGITLALLGCAAVAVVGIVGLRRGARHAAVWLALAAWLAIPNPYPWYALWILPVAAATFDRPLGVALLGATISGIVRYLPDASSALSPDARLVLTTLALGPLLWGLAALPFAPAQPKARLVS